MSRIAIPTHLNALFVRLQAVRAGSERYIAVGGLEGFANSEWCCGNEQRIIPSSLPLSSRPSQCRPKRDISEGLPCAVRRLPTQCHTSPCLVSIRSALLRYAQLCIHTIFVLQHLILFSNYLCPLQPICRRYLSRRIPPTCWSVIKQWRAAWRCPSDGSGFESTSMRKSRTSPLFLA